MTAIGGPPAIRIATRGSILARWQAEEVARLLTASDPECVPELVVVDTAGDRRLDLPVWELGGQGVFVKEVQAAVLDRRADIAVHSAKDLPSITAPGLSLASIPVRADPRDALVGGTLAGLSPGSVIATGSVRRRAQLAWIRPDLTFIGVRGNIGTRLERRPPGGAVVVAAAALSRLGLAHLADEILDPAQMLPQVGQGAIAIECRSEDVESVLGRALARIDDAAAHVAVTAERSFLARLGGGCDLPVGAYAQRVGGPSGEQELEVEGLLASNDGRVVLRRKLRGPIERAGPMGHQLAGELLADGGSDLLSIGGAP